jgi:tetratricopeptide (TPR) repeat protein
VSSRKRLAEASADDNLLGEREILTELVMLNPVSNKWQGRLRQVETELQEARLYRFDRFEQAKKHLAAREWVPLRRLLNRNPGLGDTVERLVQVWEMALAADYHLRKKDPDLLQNDARRILEKSPGSFWASFVMMGVHLDRSEYEQAREWYEKAGQVNPDHPDLKRLGWLFWVRGSGQKYVLVLLIILLIVLIKLIQPLFAWWEAFYWRRAEWMVSWFPTLGLFSLERRFGTVFDPAPEGADVRVAHPGCLRPGRPDQRGSLC